MNSKLNNLENNPISNNNNSKSMILWVSLRQEEQVDILIHNHPLQLLKKEKISKDTAPCWMHKRSRLDFLKILNLATITSHLVAAIRLSVRNMISWEISRMSTKGIMQIQNQCKDRKTEMTSRNTESFCSCSNNRINKRRTQKKMRLLIQKEDSMRMQEYQRMIIILG